MAVINQFTKSKEWQRLQTLDTKIAQMRKECRELYLERMKLVESMYGNEDHRSRSGTSARRLRDR
jgi:hypothetical protein